MKNTLFALIIFSFGIANAQTELPVKKEQDGIVVTYAFKALKGKRAEEGPQELCIVLKNNNAHEVKVSFTLAFFKDGTMDEESAEVKLDIPAGKMVKGKKLGLCWLIDKENDQKIKENAFDWELNDFTVVKK